MFLLHASPSIKRLCFKSIPLKNKCNKLYLRFTHLKTICQFWMMHSVMQRIIGPGRVLTKSFNHYWYLSKPWYNALYFCELIYYFGSLVSKMTIFVRARRKEGFIMTHYRNCNAIDWLPFLKLCKAVTK